MTATNPLQAVESELMQAIERDHARHIRRRKGGLIGALVVAGAVAISGAALAGSELSHPGLSNRPHAGLKTVLVAKRWPLSVFSRHAKVHAQRASVDAESVAHGAILAEVSRVDGITNEIYVRQESAENAYPQELLRRMPEKERQRLLSRGPHVCLEDVEEGVGSTSACDPRSAVEAEGMAWVGPAEEGASRENLVVMVPDGVSTMEVTDGSGSTHTIAVVNNVADYSAPSVAEWRFTLPDGQVVSHHSESLSRQLSRLRAHEASESPSGE